MTRQTRIAGILLAVKGQDPVTGFIRKDGAYLGRFGKLSHSDMFNTREFVDFSGVKPPLYWQPVWDAGIVRTGYIGDQFIIDGQNITTAQLRTAQKIVKDSERFTKVYVELWQKGERHFTDNWFLALGNAQELLKQESYD